MLGDVEGQAGNHFADEVVDVEDHAFTVDPPHTFDSGDEAAGFGMDVFEQGAFERDLAQLDHFGADIFAQARIGFLETDDAAELKFDRVGRKHKGALAVDFLRKAALLKQFNGFAHRASAGLIAVHQFGFGRQAGAALQAFSRDAGQQIAIDLVVFAHG
ncbi:hypothetical protein D3C78_1490200 [compost metagenome]